MKHRILALILAAAMLLGLAACGAAPAASTASSAEPAPSSEPAADEPAGLGEVVTPPPAAPADSVEESTVEASEELTEEAPSLIADVMADKIVASCSSDGGTFDPFTRASWSNVVSSGAVMFEKLVYLASDGSMKYCLAKDIEKVDDMTYKIILWDCIHDSAGNPFKASDVVFSINQFIAVGNGGAMNCLDYVEVDPEDENTVIWHCSQPFGLGDMEKNLNNPTMVTEAAYTASGLDMTQNPIGTGPYLLKDYVAGTTVLYEYDENYWARDLLLSGEIEPYGPMLQNVKEIELQIIQDASSRAIALEMGTIDIADNVNSADIQAFASNPDVQTVSLPQDAPVAFTFNCSETSPCQDVNLRKAICYALDNQGIADALSVPAVPAYGIHPRMYDAPAEWTTGAEYYDYNVDTAKELLAQSGYNGETLVLLYNDNGYNGSAAIMMQSQLEAVGIQVELKGLEMSVIRTVMYDPNEWDFRLETFGGGNYLSAVLKNFYSVDASGHLGGGTTIMMIPEAKLDSLYEALKEDNSEENIAAWNDYFTNEQCYGYSICNVALQTAARSNVNVVQANKYVIYPGACTFTD